MKYVLSMALASTMLSSVAVQAADVDPVSVPDAVHDWRGSYFGIQGGGIISGDSAVRGPTSNDETIFEDEGEFEEGEPDSVDSNGIFFDTTNDFDGALGGILGGYNFQSGNIVFGIDNDFSFTNAEVDLGGGANLELNTLSTVRARIGYAFDRVLPFVTAGLAYSSVDLNATGTEITFPRGVPFAQEVPLSADELQFGWTAGVGIEVAATDYVNFRVQYNYVDLGDEDYDLGRDTVNVELDNIHIIRAGVSIKTAPLWKKVFGR